VRAIVAGGRAAILIDEPEPVTSAFVTQAGWYSAWWPGADEAVSRFAFDGIDRLEAAYRDSGAAFAMNRRGELILSARPELGPALRSAASRHAAQTGGMLREHAGVEWYLPSPEHGIRGVPDGLDLLEDAGLRAAFPFLGPNAIFGINVRRAGWVECRALRRWLLGSARAGGAVVHPEPITGVEWHDRRHWSLRLGSGATITGQALVVAGSRARALCRRLGFTTPWLGGTRVIGALEQGARLLGSAAPMVMAADLAPPLIERSGGAEIAPELGLGTPSLMPMDNGGLRIESLAPAAPRPDQLMAIGEATLRQLAGLVPALATHRGPPGRLSVTAASLSLAPDLRPLVGAVDRRGGYLVSGLGAGVTFLLAAAGLIADYLTGRPLPPFAPTFAPARFGPIEVDGGRQPA
jgi:hypothetical protein